MAIDNKAQNQNGIGGAHASNRTPAPTDFLSLISQIGQGRVAGGVGGEYLNAFREGIKKVSPELLSGIECSIIPLNRQEYDFLRFSVIVLAYTVAGNEEHCGYHTLILEATGEKLKPEMRNIDNQQVRINLVTSDANDARLAELTASAVQENFKNRSCYNTGCTVIPATFDPKKDDLVTEVVRNCSIASIAAVNSAAGTLQPVTLAAIGSDLVLGLEMTTGNAVKYDAVGNPQRSNVNIAAVVGKKQRMNNEPGIINAAADRVKLCEIGGFVNPIWAPVQQGVMGFGYVNQQPMVPQGKLAAEFVITSVETPYAISNSAVALALAISLLVTDNNNWVQAILPKSFSANDNTELGAVNVLCNISNAKENGPWGPVVDTTAMASNLGEFNQFIGQLFRPGCVVSIDCPESAPQSWYLNQFAAAAMGDVDSINAVVSAFDELTNGYFSQYFPAGKDLFSNYARVPLGYYIDADKNKRDIRDVDLVTVCNQFKNNPDNIIAYTDTFVPRSTSGPITNLSKREGIIGHVLREQCEITGYAVRVTLSAETVAALSQSMAALKLSTSITTPLSVDALRIGTPSPEYITGSLAQTGGSFVNNVGGGYGAGRFAMPTAGQFMRRG